jgi:peptidoglycan/LPS O-acetylase OafA/YrhL
MMAALLLAAAALALRIFAVSRGFDYDFTYRFTLCRMDSLLIGACLALLMYTPAAPAARRIGFGVFAAVLAVTLFTSFFLHSESFDPSRSWFFNSVGYSLIALAFAGLVASALDPRSWTNTAFQIPLLRWFGRYSYGLYVIHYIVMGAIGTAPRHYLAERFHSKAVGVVGGAVPAIGATLVLAWLSFRFYESPFLKLKKYFEPTASPPSHIAAVAFPPSPVGEESA